MQSYQVKFLDNSLEPVREVQLDYATDDAALDDLGLSDHLGPIEVWRDDHIVARFSPSADR